MLSLNCGERERTIGLYCKKGKAPEMNGVSQLVENERQGSTVCIEWVLEKLQLYHLDIPSNFEGNK